MRIEEFTLENLGPLKKVKCDQLGSINIILGKNGTGKTFLMKSLYALTKLKSDYQKGNDNRTPSEILSEKIYWTFQSDKIGELNRKGSNEKTKIKVKIDEEYLETEFSKSTIKKITVKGLERGESKTSIFIPTKEVLSISEIVLNNRLNDNLFGYDDTYYDLAIALKKPFKINTGINKSYSEYKGKFEYDLKKSKWVYKLGNSKISINNTAEGIKKLGVIDILIKNETLNCESILFIDEPESTLHPKAISEFMEIIVELSQMGIQIFMATHSYFVIKKMYILAKKYSIDIPVINLELGEEMVIENLKDGIPNNEVIDEAIKLFDEELEVNWDEN